MDGWMDGVMTSGWSLRQNLQQQLLQVHNGGNKLLWRRAASHQVTLLLLQVCVWCINRRHLQCRFACLCWSSPVKVTFSNLFTCLYWFSYTYHRDWVFCLVSPIHQWASKAPFSLVKKPTYTCWHLACVSNNSAGCHLIPGHMTLWQIYMVIH